LAASSQIEFPTPTTAGYFYYNGSSYSWIDSTIGDINGLTDLATPAVADEILLSDTSDSNTVKKSDLDAILALYDSKTSTLTNKTFDANGTGNSLSNVETADIASGSKTGSDSDLVTGTAGTANVITIWNADGDIVDSTDAATLGGGQLKFPATQNASADANTLDDYEEGTWTPTFFDALSGGNEATYTAQQGFYTKIGNKVTVYFYLDIAGTAGMTAGNDGYIRGLPFTVKALTGSVEWAGSVHMYNITFNGTPILALHSNSAHLKVAELATGATHDFLIVSEYGTGYLTGSITYLI
jgi:hypothetical protein